MIGDLTKSELRDMSKDEIIKLLRVEWDACIENDSFKCNLFTTDNYQELCSAILKNYLMTKSNFEMFSNSPDSPYVGKLTASIYSNLTITKSEFLEFIRYLYLNGYVVNAIGFDIDRMNPESDFTDDFKNAGFSTIPLIHNLRWIFLHHQELFNVQVLANEDEEFYLKENALFFKKSDSREEILAKFEEYGTIVDLICSFNSVTSLSHKGMYQINLDTYTRSEALISQQTALVESLNETKQDQKNTVNELMKTQEEQNKIVQEMTTRFDDHKNKINNFYKDIATILSILVAAFAVIGINLSAIPKIEENFTVNVIVINLSIMLCILFMFFVMKKLVFNFQEDPNKRDNKVWYVLLGMLGVFVISTYLLGREFNQGQLTKIENSYNQKFQDHESKFRSTVDELERKITADNDEINELKQQIQNQQREIFEIRK